MADDGTGSGIRIPAMIISESDGQILANFLETASNEQLSQLSVMAEFELSRPDNRVEYDLWYSSTNNKMLDFISDFEKLDQRFDDNVLMTPHFKFWECKNCEASFAERNCFGMGKYCALDTNHKTMTGKDIILEDLRQLCIYNKEYNNENDRPTWWDYMKNVHMNCYGAVNEDCSR